MSKLSSVVTVFVTRSNSIYPLFQHIADTVLNVLGSPFVANRKRSKLSQT
jgi:hypothetical protein